MSGPAHFFLIAGEPSGDKLGANLMAGLKTLAPDTKFSGVGGPLMQAEGLESLFAIEELSVMGILEVLPRLPKLLARVRQTADVITKLSPDAVITIDSPDFCLRVLARARSSDSTLKTIHYVAPTVWAWRPERAAKMARNVDHVLALFPFEPPYMQAEGMGCDFVGHPVVAEAEPSPAETRQFRAELGLTPSEPLLLVLPGSRHGEVARMEPVFAASVAQVLSARPDVKVLVVAASPVAAMLEERLKNWPVQAILLDPRDKDARQSERRKSIAFAAADLALAASGTVSLELARAKTPMVIAYKFNWFTTRIVKKKVNLASATLINLLTKTTAVPEFLFEDCVPEKIAPCVLSYLEDEHARVAQIKAGDEAMSLLGAADDAPGLRAARAVLRVIQ